MGKIAQLSAKKIVAPIQKSAIHCSMSERMTADLALEKILFFSMSYVAERKGFEPLIRCRIHTFQACAFDRSAISPFQ